MRNSIIHIASDVLRPRPCSRSGRALPSVVKPFGLQPQANPRHGGPCRYGAFILMALALAFSLLGSGFVSAAEGDLTARAGVATTNVFVGEPFRFQIQVSGSETPGRPDLSTIKGFAVKFTGGGSNSRSSVRVINGKMTKNQQLGYLFNYELQATRPGRLSIPAIAVTADGKTTRTQALAIVVQKPSETEDFKLRLSLSKERAFVGEQLVLEAIFYFRANVSEPRLTIPLVDNNAFEVHDLESDDQPRKLELLDGKQFNTMRVRKVIIPRRAGSFPGQSATLAFKGQDGTEIRQDAFGRRVQQPRYKSYAIPSNALGLTIDPLPRQGQAANFSGHVGEYALNVMASPSEVLVGDPITLNISVTGPPLLDPVDLPPLSKQESLTRDFKVPEEIEDGAVHGKYKMFTQTVRALRDEVTAIPPIELVYFDTTKGRYETARSRAIPITVKPTRILTGGDIEGAGPLTAAKQEIQSWMQGIAHNYAGADILASQTLGFGGLASPARIALMAGPPLAYAALLLVVVTVRKRNSNPDTIRARRAIGRFGSEIEKASTSDEVLAALRAFLGDKLALTSEALTFQDVEGPLQAKGVGEEDLAEIKRLFTLGEASRFAGDTGSGEIGELRSRAGQLARQLDKKLR
jgi:hypothetical protein